MHRVAAGVLGARRRRVRLALVLQSSFELLDFLGKRVFLLLHLPGHLPAAVNLLLQTGKVLR